jgi:hypothetical protein
MQTSKVWSNAKPVLSIQALRLEARASPSVCAMPVTQEEMEYAILVPLEPSKKHMAWKHARSAASENIQTRRGLQHSGPVLNVKQGQVQSREAMRLVPVVAFPALLDRVSYAMRVKPANTRLQTAVRHVISALVESFQKLLPQPTERLARIARKILFRYKLATPLEIVRATWAIVA